MAGSKPPAKLGNEGNQGSEGGSTSGVGSGGFMLVNNLHLHGTEIHALTKMAESNPDLAHKIVDQRNDQDKRLNVSYRFGVVSTLVLVCVVVFAFAFVLIEVGVTATIGFCAFVLAMAVLIRVILVGEWSDTTWFGKFVGLIAKALGSGDSSESKS